MITVTECFKKLDELHVALEDLLSMLEAESSVETLKRLPCVTYRIEDALRQVMAAERSARRSIAAERSLAAIEGRQ